MQGTAFTPQGVFLLQLLHSELLSLRPERATLLLQGRIVLLQLFQFACCVPRATHTHTNRVRELSYKCWVLTERVWIIWCYIKGIINIKVKQTASGKTCGVFLLQQHKLKKQSCFVHTCESWICVWPPNSNWAAQSLSMDVMILLTHYVIRLAIWFKTQMMTKLRWDWHWVKKPNTRVQGTETNTHRIILVSPTNLTACH